MQTDWQAGINFVLEQEGLYDVNPADPGGETFRGISRKNWAEWLGWQKVDGWKKVPGFPQNTLNDPALLESVKNFYKVNFWDRAKCDYLPTFFAIALFDSAVNQNVEPAVTIMQRALKVKDDGIIGEMTIAAANTAPPRAKTLMLAHRLRYYHRTIVSKPNLEVFSLDWFHRVVELEKLLF